MTEERDFDCCSPARPASPLPEGRADGRACDHEWVDVSPSYNGATLAAPVIWGCIRCPIERLG